jgi:2-C-methyl-D-erythritol 2,4-cyclodiphosphate synthase
LIVRAHAVADRDGFRGTDDAILVERLGDPVRLVTGDPTNLKVTVPEDLALAEALLAHRGVAARIFGAPSPNFGGSEESGAAEPGHDGLDCGLPTGHQHGHAQIAFPQQPVGVECSHLSGEERPSPPTRAVDELMRRGTRVGLGFDAHRFAPGRRLSLGGVEIPFSRGLLGHSDADVVVHAVMDALLGAAGCGDIGRHFPPTDPAYRDARSLDLLTRVCDLLTAQGWRPAYVDVVVMAEVPRLAPHVERMQVAMSHVLGLAPGAINIKATTLEGMGPIGREEGIAAQAIATVEALRHR